MWGGGAVGEGIWSSFLKCRTRDHTSLNSGSNENMPQGWRNRVFQ